MSTSDLLNATWRKSSHSGGNGECVEVANFTASIGVRDSKAPDAGYLTFAREAWTAFAAQVRAGR